MAINGSNISGRYFPRSGIYANLVGGRTYGRGHWQDPGGGFVGFRFNNGAGVQYGWVRVRMSNLPDNAFTVVDYAYADPGEPIAVGQKSSNEQVPDQGSTDEQAPDQGSLGGLALGAIGLIAWRKSRSLAAR